MRSTPIILKDMDLHGKYDSCKIKIYEQKTEVGNRNPVSNVAIEVMKNNLEKDDCPDVGIFWYNIDINQLFDVYSTPIDEVEWHHSTQLNTDVKTDKRLHMNIWKRKNRSGDYTMIPRGRVFQFKDEGYKVMVGSWINDYPQAKQLILDVFNLPIENTEFRIDSHWDLGNSCLDEF